MSPASAPFRRGRARPGWAALAATLLCAPGAAAQQPASALACASPAADAWRCVGAVAPENLFEPFEATLSPDGTRFVFSRVEGESRHLWLVDAATGAARRLTHTPGKRQDPAWAPDGSLIAFSGDIPGPLGPPASGIGMVDPATGGERLVIATPYFSFLRHFAWTGTGRILFRLEDFNNLPLSPGAGDAHRAPRAPAADREGWWIADADGRNLARLGIDPGRPVFSPEGSGMAWIGRACEREGPGHAVWTSDVEGQGVRCIHPLPAQADWRGRLAWPHPDTLLYAGPAVDDSLSRAYLLPRDGGPARRLEGIDGEVTGVGVARDGGVGVSVYRQRARVALVPADGGAPVPLSLPGDPDGIWPEWHPSGLELAFTAVPRRTGWTLHQLSLARARLAHRGAPARPVGPAGRIHTVAGSWSPDGRHLATYTLERGTPGYGVARASRPDTPVAHAGWADPDNAGGPPAWSPDGARLLLATGSVRYGPLRDGPPWSLAWAVVDSALRARDMVYVMDHQLVPLQEFAGRAVRPRVSPDGGSIVFGAQPGAERRGGVYVVAAGGGPVRTVAEFPAGEMHTGPEWSARGDSIFFSSPDSAGVFQLRRVSRDGGPAVTLTGGTEHVLHPRVSPDGGTLAVTWLEVRTELWMRPGRFPALPPAPAPVRDTAARVHPSEVSPGLLETVLAAEARAEEVRRVWPGFWDGRQVYAVRTPAEDDAAGDNAAEALIVSPLGVPPAGFTPVRDDALPAALRGRLYHARGLAADVRAEEQEIAVAELPAGPARDAAERRERLRVLYAAAFARVRPTGDPPNAYAGCPGGDPRACAVQGEIERDLLRRALRSSGRARRELLRDYAAIAWMRGGGGTPNDLWVARHFGARAYVANRAAHAATGARPGDYEAGLAARLADTLPSRPTRDDGAAGPARTGEALAEILARLDPAWRDSVSAGEGLLDALFRVTGLTREAALVRAAESLDRHGFFARVAALPPAEGSARVAVNEHYYLVALRSLAPGTRALQIDLSRERAEAGELEFDYRAGPAGAAQPAPGLVLLPDPAWVRVRAGNVHLEVRGHPVALIRAPGNAPEHVRVLVYPRAELAGVVQSGAPGEDAGQHVRAEGIDLRIGPNADVCPCTDIYVRPAAPAPTP